MAIIVLIICKVSRWALVARGADVKVAAVQRGLHQVGSFRALLVAVNVVRGAGCCIGAQCCKGLTPLCFVQVTGGRVG